MLIPVQADTGIVDQERKTPLGQETQDFFQVQPSPAVGAPSTHVFLRIVGKWGRVQIESNFLNHRILYVMKSELSSLHSTILCLYQDIQ